MKKINAFCHIEVNQILHDLESSTNGLKDEIAADRLKQLGGEIHRQSQQWKTFLVLMGQFKNPIMLILIFAAVLSIFLGDTTDAIIILVIIGVSGFLSFWQENGAADAIEKLLAIVEVKAKVIRNGMEKEIPATDVVPGDILRVSSGCVIPGDALLIESKDLYADEASMAGETFPVEKQAGVLPEDTLLAKRTNALFMGTHVTSGTAIAVIVHTGNATEFGKVSQRLSTAPPETDFARGIRHFGYFLMQITLVLTLAIFAINVFLHKPVLDSFLFSLALAIGLTPQLLPAIISINLAHEAKKMAKENVIVKKLSSIENFGSMNILCSDKTGTITEGQVKLHSATDLEGKSNESVLRYAYLNSFFESGFSNPIDEAIKASAQVDVSQVKKWDEVPYDFIRKRLSVLLADEGENILVSKGALDNILDVCSKAVGEEGGKVELETVRANIQQQYAAFSEQGLRVLGLAVKDMGATYKCQKPDETEMIFMGFLLFFDPPKEMVHIFLFTSMAKIFGFIPLPISYFAVMWGIVLFYVFVVENVKRWFYKKFKPYSQAN